jgi:hypothetical protein
MENSGRMRIQVILMICSIVFGSALRAEKQRDWQTGKVLDTERNRYFAGTYNSGSSSGTVDGGTYQGHSSGSSVAVYRIYATYVIESDKYVYQTEERLHWRWSKPAQVIVNTPVKFAAEKRKLYIVDDEGKEHETKIVSRYSSSKPCWPGPNAFVRTKRYGIYEAFLFERRLLRRVPTLAFWSDADSVYSREPRPTLEKLGVGNQPWNALHVILEENRAEVNFDLVERLAEREQGGWTYFGRLRHEREKKLSRSARCDDRGRPRRA